MIYPSIQQLNLNGSLVVVLVSTLQEYMVGIQTVVFIPCVGTLSWDREPLFLVMSTRRAILSPYFRKRLVNMHMQRARVLFRTMRQGHSVVKRTPFLHDSFHHYSMPPGQRCKISRNFNATERTWIFQGNLKSSHVPIIPKLLLLGITTEKVSFVTKYIKLSLSI